MKRSDMVKLIEEHFEFFHNNKFDEVFRNYNDYAEALLIRIEEVGMLPPKRYRDHNWNALGMTYSDWLDLPSKVNEWEPENEEK